MQTQTALRSDAVRRTAIAARHPVPVASHRHDDAIDIGGLDQSTTDAIVHHALD